MNTVKKNILFCVLIILIAFLFFRDQLKEDIYIQPGADSLYLSSRTGQEITIPYETISSAELISSLDPGSLMEGTDNSRMRCGLWHNNAFGDYRLFTLKKITDYIVLTTDGGVVVFNYESTAVTDSIYDNLLTLLSEKGM